MSKNKYFLSYKFTGIPLERLFKDIDPIKNCIVESGHDFFCNLYDDSNYLKYKLTPKQIMDHALSELDKCTHIIVYVSGDETFGGGSAIEVGWAIAKGKPLIALIDSSLNETFTSLIALADTVIMYDDHQDLFTKLNAVMDDHHKALLRSVNKPKYLYL